MMNQRRISTFCGLGMSFAMLMSLGVAAEAQQTEAQPATTQQATTQQATVQGMIIGRDGPTMYVKTDSTPRQPVVLSDSTKATEKGGFLGWSHKDLGVAALVPGLEVKVDGSYDQDHQLVAKKVEFSRGSLKTAKQIDAGLNPVNEQVAKAQDQLMSDRKDIESSQQDIASGKQAIAQNGQAIGDAKQQIGQTNGRIGQLDQYETKGTVTVNFANGKAVVSKKDKDQLEEFVKSAADTPGFMIQVQGYASAVGSATRNQRLSSERADAVLAIIQQSGAVPMTRILAPAAMGTTDQVADNHTRAGQAENRRVVVTILVNKGITGGADQTTASATQPGQE
jgi:outer membrane protein OmpA-like peptidoglycan-associated protein